VLSSLSASVDKSGWREEIIYKNIRNYSQLYVWYVHVCAHTRACVRVSVRIYRMSSPDKHTTTNLFKVTSRDGTNIHYTHMILQNLKQISLQRQHTRCSSKHLTKNTHTLYHTYLLVQISLKFLAAHNG